MAVPRDHTDVYLEEVNVISDMWFKCQSEMKQMKRERSVLLAELEELRAQAKAYADDSALGSSTAAGGERRTRRRSMISMPSHSSEWKRSGDAGGSASPRRQSSDGGIAKKRTQRQAPPRSPTKRENARRPAATVCGGTAHTAHDARRGGAEQRAISPRQSARRDQQGASESLRSEDLTPLPPSLRSKRFGRGAAHRVPAAPEHHDASGGRRSNHGEFILYLPIYRYISCEYC